LKKVRTETPAAAAMSSTVTFANPRRALRSMAATRSASRVARFRRSRLPGGRSIPADEMKMAMVEA
jgi:hypothetical protein